VTAPHRAPQHAPYRAPQPAPQRPRPHGTNGVEPGRGPLGRWLPLLLWLGSLLAGVALFHAMGSGPLSPPPLTDPSSWQAWADDREPLTAVIAVLRLVVLALAWYLVGVTTIGSVARLSRAARLVRIADALTVPAVRRLLQGALGLGLATAMVGAATPAAYNVAPASTTASVPVDADQGLPVRTVGAAVPPTTSAEGVRLTRADDDEVRMLAAGEVDEVRPAAGDVDEVRMVASDGDAAALPLPLQLLEVADPQAEEEAGAGEVGEMSMHRVVDGSTDPVPASYDVVAGDSLWSIAAHTLEAAEGQRPEEAALLGYWGSLIEANRDRLADPDNPDLIFPGQSLVLPPLPDVGGSPP
jgi:hypothetical protein